MHLLLSVLKLACMQATYEKLQAEVPKYKMITASVLSDRLRVRTILPALTSADVPA